MRETRRIEAQLVQEVADFRRVIATLTQQQEGDLAHLARLDSHDEELPRLQRSINARSQEIARLNQLLDAELGRVEPALERARAAFRQLDVERERALESLQGEWVARYESVARRGKFPVIVPIRDGRCSGCVLELSAALLDGLQQDPTIGTCPRCERMLYMGGHCG